MRDDELFDNEEEDGADHEDDRKACLISECQQAFDDGQLDRLMFSENEYGDLLDHFATVAQDELLYHLSKQAYAKYPYSVDISVKYANALIINNEIVEALDILELLQERDPVNPIIYFLFGIANLKLGNDDQVLYFADKAASFDGKSDEAEYFQTIAINYIEKEDYERAELFVKRAEVSDSEDIEFYEELVYCYEEHGKFDLSLKYGLKYVDLDPFNYSVWFTLGSIYARTSRFDEAIEAYNYSISLYPDNADSSPAMMNKAIVFMNQEKYLSAMEIFNEIIENDSHNIGALIGMADACMVTNNLNKALDYFLIVNDLDLGHIYANTNLAYIYMVNGSLEAALNHLRAIIGMDNLDYERIEALLSKSYRDSQMVEFLLYHLVSLYKLNDMKRFTVELEEMISIDHSWLLRLYRLVPSIKRDVKILNFINSIINN